ncbi:hypothetical protein SARC_11503 [Sphaeroforma arctica JP610]|uniref:Fork-head domain-containing protein n=1 Tax=Sphaeroforma arctica JP610 TaxID=667725 RepID=A0A0L0FIX5_9EUKA|nr:hypothetical protein SARC_11503 [Sphaeroforma arctica JP610]KNC75983.1 hypothetical protein SARC_11503 [Sphaeroforma arctica JP610]|eukprot:XP_014149885.1 hypothetical protein SARC_11503 [Sphaeroforma arctica JP610]
MSESLGGVGPGRLRRPYNVEHEKVYSNTSSKIYSTSSRKAVPICDASTSQHSSAHCEPRRATYFPSHDRDLPYSQTQFHTLAIHNESARQDSLLGSVQHTTTTYNAEKGLTDIAQHTVNQPGQSHSAEHRVNSAMRIDDANESSEGYRIANSEGVCGISVVGGYIPPGTVNQVRGLKVESNIQVTVDRSHVRSGRTSLSVARNHSFAESEAIGDTKFRQNPQDRSDSGFTKQNIARDTKSPTLCESFGQRLGLHSDTQMQGTTLRDTADACAIEGDIHPIHPDVNPYSTHRERTRVRGALWRPLEIAAIGVTPGENIINDDAQETHINAQRRQHHNVEHTQGTTKKCTWNDPSPGAYRGGRSAPVATTKGADSFDLPARAFRPQASESAPNGDIVMYESDANSHTFGTEPVPICSEQNQIRQRSPSRGSSRHAYHTKWSYPPDSERTSNYRYRRPIANRAQKPQAISIVRDTASTQAHSDRQRFSRKGEHTSTGSDYLRTDYNALNDHSDNSSTVSHRSYTRQPKSAPDLHMAAHHHTQTLLDKRYAQRAYSSRPHAECTRRQSDNTIKSKTRHQNSSRLRRDRVLKSPARDAITSLYLARSSHDSSDSVYAFDEELSGTHVNKFASTSQESVDRWSGEHSHTRERALPYERRRTLSGRHSTSTSGSIPHGSRTSLSHRALNSISHSALNTLPHARTNEWGQLTMEQRDSALSVSSQRSAICLDSLQNKRSQSMRSWVSEDQICQQSGLNSNSTRADSEFLKPHATSVGSTPVIIEMESSTPSGLCGRQSPAIKESTETSANIKQENRSAKVAERRNPPMPKHTYSSLIGKCIFASRDERVTLPELYSYISERLPNGKQLLAESWQSSVRHQLASNKAFMKKRYPSKEGGTATRKYWSIKPDYRDMFTETGEYIPQGRKSAPDM